MTLQQITAPTGMRQAEARRRLTMLTDAPDWFVADGDQILHYMPPEAT